MGGTLRLHLGSGVQSDELEPSSQAAFVLPRSAEAVALYRHAPHRGCVVAIHGGYKTWMAPLQGCSHDICEIVDEIERGQNSLVGQNGSTVGTDWGHPFWYMLRPMRELSSVSRSGFMSMDEAAAYDAKKALDGDTAWCPMAGPLPLKWCHNCQACDFFVIETRHEREL